MTSYLLSFQTNKGVTVSSREKIISAHLYSHGNNICFLTNFVDVENWHYILVEPPPHQSIMEKPLKRSIFFSKREIYCKVWKFSPYQALKSGETIRNLIPPMEMISGRLSKRVKFNQMLTIFPNVANKGCRVKKCNKLEVV